MEIDVRRGRFAEAVEIAALHVAVWRETYRDLAPAEAMERLDAAFRLPGWQASLSAEDRRVFVAVAEARIVGVIAVTPPSEPAFGARGEIRGLYVDPGFAGLGIGRRLMVEAGRWFLDEGYAGCALGVVRGNDAALAFYARLGGREAGVYHDAGPIWRSENVLVVFDDLAAL